MIPADLVNLEANAARYIALRDNEHWEATTGPLFNDGAGRSFGSLDALADSIITNTALCPTCGEPSHTSRTISLGQFRGVLMKCNVDEIKGAMR